MNIDKLHSFFFGITVILLVSGVNDYLTINASGFSSGIFSYYILGVAFILYLSARLSNSNINNFELKAFKRHFQLAFFSYVILASFASLIAGRSADIIDGLRYYLPSIIIFNVVIESAWIYIKKKSFFKMLLIFKNILAINAVLVCLQFLSQGGFSLFQIEGRYSGLVSNPNDAGFLFNILIAIQYYLFKRKSNLINFIGLTLAIIAVFVTFSKT